MSPTDVNALVDGVLQNAMEAMAVFDQYDQEQTDAIVEAVCEACLDNRIGLAKHAWEETGIGKWEDKVVKNVVGSLFVYEDIKHEKTVGVIKDDQLTGIKEIANPMGPILAIIPVTNPTSTVMFKTLIALKARNPIIICPSNRAVGCCNKTAQICYEAALKAGAPENCIQWFDSASREQTAALMKHPKTALILATGGEGLVHAAYASGTPALGVGAGNVPVMIEASADPAFAASQIILSKTFDNGTICASEQTLIVEEKIEAALRKEIEQVGGYFLNPEEVAKLTPVAYNAEKKMMNSAVDGQDVLKIAESAGLDVPETTTMLMVPYEEVGEDSPFSHEILAPILGYKVVKDFHEGMNYCIELNFFGGIGHSAAIYSNDDDAIELFGRTMCAGRIIVNTPSSQGAVGGIFNCLKTSFTLGCGTGGNNITSDNITATHLMNVNRVARRNDNTKFLNMDTSLLFDTETDATDVIREYHKNS